MTKLNSKNLLLSFITKYINTPTQTTPKTMIDKIRYKFALNDNFSFLHDVNYSIILTQITGYERVMFVRFFQVYLFKAYGIKKTFIESDDINWNQLIEFLATNKIYHNLFLTCFYYFF